MPRPPGKQRATGEIQVHDENRVQNYRGTTAPLKLEREREGQEICVLSSAGGGCKGSCQRLSGMPHPVSEADKNTNVAWCRATARDGFSHIGLGTRRLCRVFSWETMCGGVGNGWGPCSEQKS